MKTPRFTVVTPSFNQGAFIEKTIDSVLSQGYPNLEYIIIDGGSKDNSVEIIKKYERHLTYWVSETDRGQSDAINKGMARATGEWLTWLNSDDWYTSNALWTFSDMAHHNPSAGLIVGAGRVMNSDGACILHKTPNEEITLSSLYNWFDGTHFLQPSSMFSNRAWRECGPLDECEHIVMDLDLWLKIARKGFNIVSTNDILAEALAHPDAKTTAFANLMQLEGLLVIGKHGGTKQLRDGLLRASRQFDTLNRRLAWYEKNYEIIVNHPMLRLLRPLIKRLSPEGQYWQSKIPPWVR